MTEQVEAHIGDIVTFYFGGKEMTGVLLRDTSFDTVRVRTGKHTFKVPNYDVVAVKLTAGEVMAEESARARHRADTNTKIVWYGDFAMFHGERWSLVSERGRFGTGARLVMPDWASKVAALSNIPTSYAVYGVKKQLRLNSQLIIDRALETEHWPFARKDTDG